MRVTLVQTDAGPDPEENWKAIVDGVRAGGAAGCDVAALPEVCLARGGDAAYQRSAAPVPGPWTDRLGALAREVGVWIAAGSLIERDGERLYNTSIVVDREGRLAATYRKIHLFDAVLDDGRVIRESASFGAGVKPVCCEIEGWRCGLSICYDLRFPELYRTYAAEGARVLFIPANFTSETGRAHWELLVRARAVENQCYVIAVNQCGRNAVTGVESYGHSLAVGPWGDILGEGDESAGTFTVPMDAAAIEAVRRKLPSGPQGAWGRISCMHGGERASG